MSIQVGEMVQGKVASVKNFGAFVNLGNQQSGMIHISEISDEFIKDINDYLAIGDEVTVKVIKITDDGKINLSLKQAQETPFSQGNEAPASQPTPQQKPLPSKVFTKETESSSDEFDKMMSRFLKDSEDNLLSLRRNTEGKRGGRGGRRK